MKQAYRVRIARRMVLSKGYRSRRLEMVSRELAYWACRRESATTAAERTYCSKMVAMYLGRQRWYIAPGRNTFLEMLDESDRNKVLAFIQQFKGQEKFYLEGFCYYFAAMLRERFSMDHDVDGRPFRTELWYNPVQNHFACFINGALFDASGAVVSTNEWLQWDVYREVEPLDSSRTVRYCIQK